MHPHSHDRSPGTVPAGQTSALIIQTRVYCQSRTGTINHVSQSQKVDRLRICQRTPDVALLLRMRKLQGIEVRISHHEPQTDRLPRELLQLCGRIPFDRTADFVPEDLAAVS